jgi:hypothetical protein
VQRLRERFGIERLVMVGDRGMIGQAAIEELRQRPGIDWLTALKSALIRALVERGQLQLDLFDERNLIESASPGYSGERLVACRNPHGPAARRQGAGQDVEPHARRWHARAQLLDPEGRAGPRRVGRRIAAHRTSEAALAL